MSTFEKTILEAQSNRKTLSQVDIHFAGDSGDGMQVLGMRFSEASSIAGNDIRTFPDYPAEIRAPQGTLAGVSGFQISFSAEPIYTQGDQFDVLVAMNPAALKVSVPALKQGGILVVDEDKFVKKEYERVGYTENPLLNPAIEKYRLITIPLTQLTLKSVEHLDISRSKARKCKNIYILGVLFWLYHRPLEPTKAWIRAKFKEEPLLLEANLQALRAGYNYAITTELFAEFYSVAKAELKPGHYRQVTGNQALVLGCLSVAAQNNHSLFLSGYPITPASDVLHELTRYPHMGVKAFQAEDEIAAVGSALGAAYAGELAITVTSGPGLDLMSETLGLAVMTELPMVVVNVQRAGPSTGMPTKVEQSDLRLALYGRHGECPLPVLAAKSASDCFEMVRLAFRIAVEYMTPVILLSDAYLANCAESWQIPSLEKLAKDSCNIKHPTHTGNEFQPYARNEHTLSRPWAVPGTPNLEHRIGGLEKQHLTGNISYLPENHEKMVRLRQEKIERVEMLLPPLECMGAQSGDTLVIGWGSTYGATMTAIRRLQQEGHSISYVHLQSLYPFQKELSLMLKVFKRVLIVELNSGQLCQLIRATFLVPAVSIQKTQGKPFQVEELVNKIKSLMK